MYVQWQLVSELLFSLKGGTTRRSWSADLAPLAHSPVALNIIIEAVITLKLLY